MIDESDRAELVRLRAEVARLRDIEYVARSSNAFIAGNTISRNGRNGVHLEKNGQAEVTANAIDGNAASGVFVTQNSGAHLGSTAGPPLDGLGEYVLGPEHHVWSPVLHRRVPGREFGFAERHGRPKGCNDRMRRRQSVTF